MIKPQPLTRRLVQRLNGLGSPCDEFIFIEDVLSALKGLRWSICRFEGSPYPSIEECKCGNCEYIFKWFPILEEKRGKKHSPRKRSKLYCGMIPCSCGNCDKGGKKQ